MPKRVRVYFSASIIVLAMAALLAGANPDGGKTPDHFSERLHGMELVTLDFAEDPGWQGELNQMPHEPEMVRQRFGWSNTPYAGGTRGEIGGLIARSVTPAWYGIEIPETDLTKRLAFSGKIVNKGGGGEMLFGYFNSDTSGWRIQNFCGFRIDTEEFEISVTTGSFKANGLQYSGLFARADSGPHDFAFEWDPDADEGRGVLRLSLGEEKVEYKVGEELDFRAEPTTLNRLGIINCQKSQGARLEFYIDDLICEYTGKTFDFSSDPRWESRRANETYEENVLRAFQDYGFSPTNFAGGEPGEIGGIIWRWEKEYGVSYYATSVKDLSLEMPLLFSGFINFRRGATDSGFLFGFFDKDLAYTAYKPLGFLGVAVEGPTRLGHYFNLYAAGTREKHRPGEGSLIQPDGTVRHFEFRYDPLKGDHGTASITLEDEITEFPLPSHVREDNPIFDSIGFLPFRSDGLSVEVYVDDLTYTAGKKE
ncbi:MAG: hypothetical protein NUW37_05715 [Planctomycetes bacterium]|nr:hypothetical protein [Planctomycetota bacterium]